MCEAAGGVEEELPPAGLWMRRGPTSGTSGFGRAWFRNISWSAMPREDSCGSMGGGCWLWIGVGRWRRDGVEVRLRLGLGQLPARSGAAAIYEVAETAR